MVKSGKTEGQRTASAAKSVTPPLKVSVAKTTKR